MSKAAMQPSASADARLTYDAAQVFAWLKEIDASSQPIGLSRVLERRHEFVPSKLGCWMIELLSDPLQAAERIARLASRYSAILQEHGRGRADFWFACKVADAIVSASFGRAKEVIALFRPPTGR